MYILSSITGWHSFFYPYVPIQASVHKWAGRSVTMNNFILFRCNHYVAIRTFRPKVYGFSGRVGTDCAIRQGA